MTKAKYLIMVLFATVLLLLIPNTSNAAVEVTRNIYSNNGSMKFTFTGLELDLQHQYEFGLTTTIAEPVGKWYSIQELTTTSATVDIISSTGEFLDVINATDTGYVTIRDVTDSNKVILENQSVDLKIPYLQVTNYSVLPNGKEFGTFENATINIALRNAYNSKAYYQYEKITDEEIISKYNEIKSNNGEYTELQEMLSTNEPDSGWTEWTYWNGYDWNGLGGYGCPERPIKAPDTGLYYMWVYFSGSNLKNIYGYILIDNLQPSISVESISLPKTATVELGKTLTLTPTFNPSSATNKIVTWTSSDESVATVDNSGKITPKKIGSTIITVTTEDGNKQATCTVTVTAPSNGSGAGSNGGTNNGGTNGATNNGGSGSQDTTIKSGSLPRTGTSVLIISIVIIISAGSIICYSRYNKLKDIK